MSTSSPARVSRPVARTKGLAGALPTTSLQAGSCTWIPYGHADVFALTSRTRLDSWIAVYTFQILTLETDLVALPLNAEHISIEYAPVQFHTSKQELWLPQG